MNPMVKKAKFLIKDYYKTLNLYYKNQLVKEIKIKNKIKAVKNKTVQNDFILTCK